jgi:hypothetical protein
VRIVLGKPQRRGGDTHLAAVAIGYALADEDLLGRLGLADAHQGVHKPGPRRRDERVLRSQVPGQPFGVPERRQRIGVPAAGQLDPPADMVDRQRRHGLSFRSDGALDAPPPGPASSGLPCQAGTSARIE